MNRLVCIPFSHYVEKARWAMDRAEIPYEELRYMPVFSMAAVAFYTVGRGGKGDKVSTRWSVPTLIREDGSILSSSADIARWASDSAGLGWFDPPGTEALEQELHDQLGPHTRRVAYWLGLDDPEILGGVADANVSARQARAFRMAAPVIGALIRRGLAVDEPHALRSLDKCRAQFDRVAARLSDGRPFLMGDRFSAADLTFACMAVPGFMPSRTEGFGGTLPPIDRLPDRAREIVAEIRAHPAGAFALELFRTERRPAGT